MAILAHVTWPRAQPLDGSISLKFSLETWLESKCFEPLINFISLLVKSNDLKTTIFFNYLIGGLISLFVSYVIISEPETLASHPKYQRTWILA